jgi:16S rRNA (adenine1518-N6/adenine1519-N6)-dimethyltransferase
MPEEIFDIADENDNITGQATRKECHEKGLIHRSVMFFVFDDEGRVLVTKRTQNKDFFPGYWSIVLGGHLLASESYEEAVKRELLEEVGISGEPFFITSFKKRIPEEKENVKVFRVTVKGPITLNPNELAVGIFMDPDDLEDEMAGRNLLPETPILLEELRRMSSR